MLGSSNFVEVRQLIWEVRSNYRNFGIALGLLPSDISTIVQSNHHDTVSCFDGVLDEILRRGLTKNQLAEALESQTLRYGQLAQKVRAKTFSSGMSFQSQSVNTACVQSDFLHLYLVTAQPIHVLYCKDIMSLFIFLCCRLMKLPQSVFSIQNCTIFRTILFCTNLYKPCTLFDLYH